MTIAFYEHPFSSYVQKAKTVLYEKAISFESKMIDGSEPASEFAALWPILRFPVIVDDGPSCSRRRASSNISKRAFLRQRG
jgi:glutathione S-transferase